MSLYFYLSFRKSSSWSLLSPDDKLSENIWLIWSRTSYTGNKCRFGWEEEEDVTMEKDERTSEDRATQLSQWTL